MGPVRPGAGAQPVGGVPGAQGLGQRLQQQLAPGGDAHPALVEQLYAGDAHHGVAALGVQCQAFFHEHGLEGLLPGLVSRQLLLALVEAAGAQRQGLLHLVEGGLDQRGQGLGFRRGLAPPAAGRWRR